MPKKILITTAIDYTNDVIHLGHAYQKVLADAFARYHRLLGDETFFLTGTDEHGLQTQQAAEKLNVTPKALVDDISQKDKEQLQAFAVSFDRFIRTTDPDHIEIVKDFWQRVVKNIDPKTGKSDTYLGEYTGRYCPGCEEFKTEREIEGGRCIWHQTRDLEEVKEKNYFFRWSRYAPFLKNLLSQKTLLVLPESRKNEMLSFIDEGLADIPVSRPKEKISWGIEVPGDSSQVMYVWFDALINYISGKPDDWQNNKTEIIHFLGKDNTRWHALLWPAMLESAGYRQPNIVYSHGFITLNGQKISKSRGNIIRPTDLAQQFGVDAIRYYLLRYGPLVEDIDITLERVKEIYNSDLANGLGNLVARVLAMAEKYCQGQVPPINQNADEHPLRVNEEIFNWKKSWRVIDDHMVSFSPNEALAGIWKFISEADHYIDEEKPWVLAKEGKAQDLNWSVYGLLDSLHQLAWQILPFLPATSRKIAQALGVKELLVERPNYKDSWVNLTPGTMVKKGEPLFPRI